MQNQAQRTVTLAVLFRKQNCVSRRTTSQPELHSKPGQNPSWAVLYNPTTQLFSVYNGSGTAAGNLGWTDVTSNQSATPSAGGQWTAIQTIVSVSQPTYFMRVFGVTGMPVSARATAVFRPVDVAFVLDMTGSMSNSCHFAYNGVSNNPDTNVPVFAHYNSQSITKPGTGPGSTVLVATGPVQYGTGGTATVLTPNITHHHCGGPPLVGNFVWNGDNLTSMTTASTVTTRSTLMSFQRDNLQCDTLRPQRQRDRSPPRPRSLPCPIRQALRSLM